MNRTLFNSYQTRWLLAVFLVMIWTGQAIGQDKISQNDLIHWAGSSPDTVTLIRVKDLKTIAGSNNFGFSSLQDFGVPDTVPEWAGVYLEAGSYKDSGEMKSASMLMDMPSGWTFDDVAKHQGARLHKKNGVPYFDDTFGIRTWCLESGLIVSQWPKKRPLKKAASPLAKLVNKRNGHLLLGFDAGRQLSSAKNRNAFIASLGLTNEKHKKLLSSCCSQLKFVLMSLETTSESVFRIEFVFGKKIDVSEEDFKQLLLLCFRKWQIDLPGGNQFSVEGKGNSVTAAWKISGDEVYMIGSSFFSLGGLQDDAVEEGWQKDSSRTVDQKKTKQFVLSLDRSIRKLDRLGRKGKHLLFVAHVLEKEAEKLRRRKYKEIDPEVIQYAEGLHQLFRSLSQSLQTQSAAVESLNRSITVELKHIKGGWVWGRGLTNARVPNIRGGEGPEIRIESNQGDVRKRQAELAIKENQTRRQLWEKVWKRQVEIRNRLREKYGAQFLKAEPIR